jgi:hypothetical protein
MNIKGSGASLMGLSGVKGSGASLQNITHIRRGTNDLKLEEHLESIHKKSADLTLTGSNSAECLISEPHN